GGCRGTTWCATWTNQQWQPVKETSGRYHFVARHSGKCLSAATTATNSVQLTQRTCDNSAAQSFALTVQP
ncbi:RICIN domain-containing protein, partial [Streptomyces avermitilis]|uniref:RICIN domain-containing protein n=1 Tax=Streptomyces avermitilis TaxID=33903 RepID=UPI0033B0BF82